MSQIKRLVFLTIVPLVLVACGQSEDRAARPSAPASSSPAAPAPAPAPAPATAAPPAVPQGSSAASPAAGADPTAGSSSRAATAPAAGTHVVVRGDTLQKIAKARGVSADDLAKWNNIDDPRRLRIGQELRLTPP